MKIPTFHTIFKPQNQENNTKIFDEKFNFLTLFYDKLFRNVFQIRRKKSNILDFDQKMIETLENKIVTLGHFTRKNSNICHI